jgi:outer membrane protein assembly factor BamB
MLPAVGPDGTIYAAPAGQRLFALRPDGSVLWTYDTGFVVRTSVVVDGEGTAYLGGDGDRVVAVSRAGARIWEKDVGDLPRGLAIGRGGVLYVVCDADKVQAWAD